MKPTDVLVAVMLMLGEIFFIGCSYNTKKKREVAAQEGKLILPEDSVNEMKMTSLPPSKHKDATSKKAFKVKPVKPIVSTITIVRDCSACECGGSPPVQEEVDSIIFLR